MMSEETTQNIGCECPACRAARIEEIARAIRAAVQRGCGCPACQAARHPPEESQVREVIDGLGLSSIFGSGAYAIGQKGSSQEPGL